MTQDCFFHKSFSPTHPILQAEKYLSKVKTSKYAEVLLFISNLQLIPELLENDDRDSDILKPKGTFTSLQPDHHHKMDHRNLL